MPYDWPEYVDFWLGQTTRQDQYALMEKATLHRYLTVFKLLFKVVIANEDRALHLQHAGSLLLPLELAQVPATLSRHADRYSIDVQGWSDSDNARLVVIDMLELQRLQYEHVDPGSGNARYVRYYLIYRRSIPSRLLK